MAYDDLPSVKKRKLLQKQVIVEQYEEELREKEER
jgi:hypothetical protein